MIFLLTATCAWFLFSDFLVQMLWPEGVEKPIYQAVAQDDRGNVYIAQNKSGVNTLVALDDAGNTLLNEPLSQIQNASEWLVEDLFVASSKHIVVAAAKLDRQTETITERSLHLLYENGAYAGEIMRLETRQNIYLPKAGAACLSNISETDTDLLFGVYSEGRIKTYALEKGGSSTEPVLVRDLEVAQAPERFIVLPEHRLVLYAPAQGFSVYEPEGQLPLQTIETSVIPDRMLAGGGDAVYLHDAASGGFYLLSGGTISAVISGETALSAAGARSFGDLRLAHITAGERVAGFLQQNDSTTLMAGTRLYMNEVRLTGAESEFGAILGLIGIVLGVLLLSVLLWDAYCRLLKMRVSIMVRQSLLIVAGVAAMVYLLMTILIEPAMQSTLRDQYRGRVEAAADVLAVNLNNTAEPETVINEFKNSAQNESESEWSPIHFELYSLSGGRIKLAASSDNTAPGTDARHMPWHVSMEEALNTASASGTYVMETSEAQGERMYVLKALPGDYVLAAVSGTESISLRIMSIITSIVQFLFIAGAVLVLVLVLIESITVFRIRKLKKCVDAVSGGDYSMNVQLRSGDEVESLANSFNTMTKLIRSSMQKMNRINESYFRFVPENMIKLLGVSSVEKLDRGACVQARMTVMVAHFSFQQTDTQKNTEQLFAEINEVLQALTPAVSEHGGTVYNLLSDGFNAVFGNEYEDAVRAALKVRSCCAVLNDKRREEGREPVEVYLVLTVGDVMLGVVGDETRLSPTAISDAIVDAQSILGICPESNIYICCTEALMAGISGYRNRYVGQFLAPNGVQCLYDLFDGDPQALLKHKQMCEGKFRAAVQAYYQKDFQRAKLLFMEIIKLSLADKTSVNYLYFSDRYMAQPQLEQSPTYQAMPKRG